jgi:PHD/YefM family antitoxin component YafN of YafNO toxin-antitoxin module
MAVYKTYDTVGIREDLADIIYSISPTETPFMSGVAKTKATNTSHQWQTDALAAVAANAAVEGATISYGTQSPTTKETNYTQISTKAIQVSGTNDAVTSAGRNSELAYQVAKAAKELKRDMETALLSNNAAEPGDASTARELGGVQTWIETNVSAGSGAGNGAARVDGTQRAFTEDQLKEVLRKCYNEGGNPNMIMVGAFNKQKLSGFTGGSTRFDAAEDRRLVTAIDVYESDFGTLQVAPNRFIRGANATAAKVGQDALVLEMDYFAVAFLRDFALQTPAQTADADQRFMVAEYTLESRNEKASGAVYDLTTS